jgi:hypothetical protein
MIEEINESSADRKKNLFPKFLNIIWKNPCFHWEFPLISQWICTFPSSGIPNFSCAFAAQFRTSEFLITLLLLPGSGWERI